VTIIELFKMPVRIERDLCYLPETGEDRHRLDVYAPPDAAGLPVVIYYYGGGWRSGDKDLFEHLGRAFAVRGIVAVVVNYRLTPDVRSPAHAEDCAAAAAWVHEHVATYGGDPSKIVLMGHSAGAHLAALLGVDRRYLDHHGFDHAALRGVVPISGVYELVSHVDTTVFTSAEHVREAFGKTDEELAAASPLRYVRAGLPPFLVVVAEEDPPGLRQQAREFADALREADVETFYISVKARDHFSIVRRFGPSSDATARAVAEFIHHVCRTSAAT
jgi:acetyl esterase/lipase